MMTDDTDQHNGDLPLQDGVATSTVDMTAVDKEAVVMTMTDKYAAANKLLQEVDANIVKTARLRKQMPAKCATLLAQRCKYQLSAIVSIVCHVLCAVCD